MKWENGDSLKLCGDEICLIIGFVRMGFRNTFRRKRVATFTILSIAISVSLLYTGFSVNNNLQQSANMFIQDTYSPVDITLSSTKWGVPITSEMNNKILTHPNIVSTIPRIEEYVRYRNGSDWIYILLIGLDLEHESNIGSLNATDGVIDLTGNGCFLTNEAREILNHSIRDELELTTSAGLQFFNITGFGLAIDKGAIGPIVFISIERAWEIYTIRYPDKSYNKLLIEVQDLFSIPYTASFIQDICGSDFIVTNQKAYPLQLATMFLSQTQTVLVALILIAGFISAFRVFSSFAMVFSERRYETGVLLAYGALRKQIGVGLASEILVISVIGASVGVLIGLVISTLITGIAVVLFQVLAIAPSIRFFQFTNLLDFTSILIACTAGIMLTFLSAFLPAWRATRTPIVESIGHSASSSSQSKIISKTLQEKIRIIFGMLSIGLLFLVSLQITSDLFSIDIIDSDTVRILSVPAFLMFVVLLSPGIASQDLIQRGIVARKSQVVKVMSNRNMRRNTLSMLIMVNLFTSLTVLFLASTNAGYTVTETWRRNVELQTTSANIVVYMDPPADENQLRYIESVEGVEESVAMNQVLDFVYYKGHLETVLILSVEPDRFEKLASLAVLDSLNTSQGLGVVNSSLTCVISKRMAESFDIALADEITLTSGYNLSVVGTCISSVPVFSLTVVNPIFIIISPETWSVIQEDPFTASGILIESSNPNDTINQISQIPGAHPFLISSLEADYLSALNSIQLIIDTSLISLFATTIFSALLSGWTIASARRREIGLLSSMGMTRNEIAQVITAENATAMISGTIVGFLVGIIVEISLAEIVYRLTGEIPALFDFRIIAIILLCLFVSIIFAYIAIRRTCDTQVITLLRDVSRGH